VASSEPNGEVCPDEARSPGHEHAPPTFVGGVHRPTLYVNEFERRYKKIATPFDFTAKTSPNSSPALTAHEHPALAA
jgi:hypothetical protein